MAKRSGKINLDITSIRLALLENLARIDLDLKEQNFKCLKQNKKSALPTAAKIEHVFVWKSVEFTGSRNMFKGSWWVYYSAYIPVHPDLRRLQSVIMMKVWGHIVPRWVIIMIIGLLSSNTNSWSCFGAWGSILTIHLN